MDENKSRPKLSLKGADIMPTLPEERTMTNVGMLCVWWGMAINLTLFIAGAQLYPGASPLAITILTIVGNIIVAVLLTLNGDIGFRYGITFSVYLRAVFGYVGAHVPSLIRALSAIFWFGYQTWFCAYALDHIMVTLTGYSNIWLLIIAFAILQIWNMTHGTKAVAFFEKIAAPMILVVGIYLLFTVLGEYNSSVGEVLDIKASGGIALGYVICAQMGHFMTMTLNIMEFTRIMKRPDPFTNSWAKTNFGSWWSQTIGLVSSLALFTLIGICCGVLTGEWNPINVMIDVVGSRSVPLLFLCLLFVLFATWSTNTAANLLPPTYVFVNLYPRKINVKVGAIVGGVLGIAMQPWRIMDQTALILNTMGTVLGAICGIMICDYYIIRKKRLVVKDLYDENGQYRYYGNWNPAGIIALACSIPAGMMFPNYSVPVVFAVGMGVYFVLMKCWIIKKFPQPETTDPNFKVESYTYVEYDPEND